VAGNTVGRPKGAWSEKRFREALQAAVTEEGAGGQKRLRNIAEKLVAAAEDGDIAAIREVADRLDGKPAQAIEHSGAVDVAMTLDSVIAEMDARVDALRQLH
jgi:hypothetical protein